MFVTVARKRRWLWFDVCWENVQVDGATSVNSTGQKISIKKCRLLLPSKGTFSWAIEFHLLSFTECDTVKMEQISDNFFKLCQVQFLSMQPCSEKNIHKSYYLILRRVTRDRIETSHWAFISCTSVTWAPPLLETSSSVKSVHSYGRNEPDHRLWLIFSPHHHQDTYWTHF